MSLSRDVVAQMDAALAHAGHTGGAVGIVRLDGLEAINESIGYEHAGLLLEEFRYRLRSMLRRQDSMFALEHHRAALLLPGLRSAEHIALAAAKLERLFERPIEVHDESVKVSVHAGFVLLTRVASAAEALRRAETALRIAKEERRGWSVGEADAVQVTPEPEVTLRNRIEAGIADGQFVMYLQPKVHARNGAVVGAEALMRWQDPERGVLSPGTFIDVAERAGLIRPLTWFAIKASLAECSQWRDDVGVAVNIAPELFDDELLAVVVDALAIFAVAPGRLTLEVTESGLARNRDDAFDLLTRLRATGVRVAIDDFGTGYSSFAHFRDIPADEIKIDRSFVARLCSSDADVRIVKSIIELGHNFSMQLVAEGVEDEATAVRLEQLGCDHLQGYWIAKPAPAAEFRDWLEWRRGTPPNG